MSEPNPQQAQQPGQITAPEVQQQAPNMPEMAKQVIDDKAVLGETMKAKEEAQKKFLGTQQKINILAGVKVDEIKLPKL